MKPNFQISLPSIPGQTIKFKIQDIKQTSFGSRKERFMDNKRGLTKKFIESFNNFHQPKKNVQTETQASQTGNSRISSRSFTQNTSAKTYTFNKEKQEKKFRHMIPQQRKHIISVYDKYKQYEPAILQQSKYDQGYTFSKAAKEIIKGNSLREEEENESWTKKFVTDNYYFTETVMDANAGFVEEEPGESHKNNDYNAKQGKKRQKPSAVFKNITRQRVWSKAYNNQVPGPGYYISIQAEPEQDLTKKPPQSNPTPQSQPDYKKLKQLITSIVQQPQQSLQQEISPTTKKQREQHMFVKDDRDRFGDQKYPIAPKLNVPGPGTYQIMKGIEDQARKVALVEEQRKLLKDWFNN